MCDLFAIGKFLYITADLTYLFQVMKTQHELRDKRRQWHSADVQPRLKRSMQITFLNSKALQIYYNFHILFRWPRRGGTGMA